MTDGILLAELERDRSLRRYDTIILDEAHERSLNVDFLLGYLARLLPRRPDLKLIITSATIDPERFSRHFGGAPVVEVSGPHLPGRGPLPAARARTPTTTATRPRGSWTRSTSCAARGRGTSWSSSAGSGRSATPPRPCAGHELPPQPGRGRGAAAVRAAGRGEQHRVFQAHAGRRVVLATNVAETSLTVPGIKYVVDPGTARISRYSHRSKVQRLPIEPVSQASANQRKGRCGRTSDGICIRLYSEDDFASPARVHRAGDPAHQPGLGDPPDDLAAAGRHRPVPVHRPARPAQRQGRPRPPRRAGRPGRRPPDPGGPQAGPDPGRPAAGPDAAGGGPARLRPRGAGDRGRPVHPGPARAPGRQAGAGRRAPPPLRRQGLRLPDLAQPLALPARTPGRAVLQPVPQAAAGPSSSTTCGCASGRTCTASSARSPATSASGATRPPTSPTPTASTPPCWPGCSATSGSSRATPASTWGRGGPGSPSSPARRWPGSRRSG